MRTSAFGAVATICPSRSRTMMSSTRTAMRARPARSIWVPPISTAYSLLTLSLIALVSHGVATSNAIGPSPSRHHNNAERTARQRGEDQRERDEPARPAMRANLIDELPQAVAHAVEKGAGNIAARPAQEFFCGMGGFVLLVLPAFRAPFGGGGAGRWRRACLLSRACSDAFMRHSPARRQCRRSSVTISRHSVTGAPHQANNESPYAPDRRFPQYRRPPTSGDGKSSAGLAKFSKHDGTGVLSL